MQFSTLALPLLSLLPALVQSTACVAGGPTDQIAKVKTCCYNAAGTWYQFYSNQAICVLADNRAWGYNECVRAVAYSQLDTKCIPGDGQGLSTAFGTATQGWATSARETITA